MQNKQTIFRNETYLQGASSVSIFGDPTTTSIEGYKYKWWQLAQLELTIEIYKMIESATKYLECDY